MWLARWWQQIFTLTNVTKLHNVINGITRPHWDICIIPSVVLNDVSSTESHMEINEGLKVLHRKYTIFIPPLQRSLLVSPCPSVRLWTESCPLYIFNNTYRIHFIFAHLIKQLQKVCSMLCPFLNSKIWNFGEFFKFVTLTLSSFDLGSNMTQWYG